MEIIIMLIGFSLLVATLFFFAFLWAVKSGQYEDQITPSIRMLFEGNSTPPKEHSSVNNKPKREN